MAAYLRPHIEPQQFYDTDGALIDYGRRWEDGPPEEAYSVATHPERFAPIGTVAEALIAHLTSTYDVEVDQGPRVADDIVHPGIEVVRAVRLRPRDTQAAPIAFTFDSIGITLYAGALYYELFPSCGCDACDDDWEHLVDVLEEQVFAIVNGRLAEKIGWGPNPLITYGYVSPRTESSQQSRGQYSKTRIRTARQTLGKLRNGWVAWPLR